MAAAGDLGARARWDADALRDIEQALRRAGKGYVLGDHRFGSWGDKPVSAGTARRIDRSQPCS